MERSRGFLWVLTGFLFLGTVYFSSLPVHADEPLVIVLDPGHGGENLGGEYAPYLEKELTMVVAEAMKEELEEYEGVEVYLTRETDEDMTIKDRALFAAEKQADFLFCLHFNMSVEHNLYGAEVWVPAFGDAYAKGYAFAEIEMQELTDLGLFSRGIKTRLNKQDDNYYGILRYCTQEGVPSVLIEHCHLDNENDQDFYQQGREQLEAFGRLDARAVAKYFHLKSESLGVDYGNYPVSEIPVPEGIVRPDQTPPEVCTARIAEVDQDTGEITIDVEAYDRDSYILYYSYSLDGGASWSGLLAWPRPQLWNQSAPEHSFTVQAPYDREIELLVTAYNGFDGWIRSAPVVIEAIPDPQRIQAEEMEKAGTESRSQETDENGEQAETAEAAKPQEEAAQKASYGLSNGMVFLLIILILVCMGIVVFILVKTVQTAVNNKRR